MTELRGEESSFILHDGFACVFEVRPGFPGHFRVRITKPFDEELLSSFCAFITHDPLYFVLRRIVDDIRWRTITNTGQVEFIIDVDETEEGHMEGGVEFP
jgi:hypothetical protein